MVILLPGLVEQVCGALVSFAVSALMLQYPGVGQQLLTVGVGLPLLLAPAPLVQPLLNNGFILLAHGEADAPGGCLAVESAEAKLSGQAQGFIP